MARQPALQLRDKCFCSFPWRVTNDLEVGVSPQRVAFVGVVCCFSWSKAPRPLTYLTSWDTRPPTSPRTLRRTSTFARTNRDLEVWPRVVVVAAVVAVDFAATSRSTDWGPTSIRGKSDCRRRTSSSRSKTLDDWSWIVVVVDSMKWKKAFFDSWFFPATWKLKKMFMFKFVFSKGEILHLFSLAAKFSKHSLILTIHIFRI